MKYKKIMVTSPSRSMSIISDDVRKQATKTLESLGYKVSFSNNCSNSIKYYNCASLEDRLNDFEQAISSDCDLILSVIGGYNCNQMLPYLDYDKIKKSKKKICGFSDITAILNAIYAKTGLITYYGPHFSSFGMKYELDYTKEFFIKCMNKKTYKLVSSQFYRDDPWYLDQEKVNNIKNDGLVVINKGKSEGVILGGNLCTFNLLLGTPYMPKSKDIILFIEDDAETGDNFLLYFDRNLENILQSSLMPKIRGIVIGRAQESSNMTVDKWKSLIKNKKALKDIPVIVNANFGHTTPIITFPIGGYCKINNDEIIISEKKSG